MRDTAAECKRAQMEATPIMRRSVVVGIGAEKEYPPQISRQLCAISCRAGLTPEVRAVATLGAWGD